MTDTLTNRERGLRAVVSDLVANVGDFGAPAGERQRAEFVEKWGERILRATGFHRVVEERDALRRERDTLANALGRLASGEEVARFDASAEDEVRARIALAKSILVNEAPLWLATFDRHDGTPSCRCFECWEKDL